jgi:hypothetical protein
MLNGLIFRSGISGSAGNSARTAATRKAPGLAWSDASFLAAARARTGQDVPGWPPDAQDKDARPFGQRDGNLACRPAVMGA